MKYLLFKLAGQEFNYCIVSSEYLYLLKDSEFASLDGSVNQEVLKEVFHINKKQISKLIFSKDASRITIYDLEGIEKTQLSFNSQSYCKQFLKTFTGLKKELVPSTGRIRPLNAVLVMLFAYSFIWAGTRQSLADINPEGIRFRIAYWNVEFLAWLNGLIGQKAILLIGIILIVTLGYFIFKPEINSVFKKKVTYLNTTVE